MIDMVSSNNTFANNSMIFKTIDSSVDNTRKTLALFNKDWNTYKTNWQQGFSQNGVAGGIKSIFQSSNSNSVISKDQLQILRNWNNAVAHGCTNQETFNRIIKDADSNTKLYFSGLNKGKGSVEGLKNAQNVAKQSTIGLTLAQTALNAAISLGFTAALMLAVKGLDKLINSAKRASEAADEAFSDTTEKVQKNEEEAKSLDELISKYKELKESENLDVDGRKEIKEIQNDIADLVGVQASNLDLVNGKLDDEIAKLDEISAKEAKNAYETATANYNNSKKATDKAAGDDSFLFVDGYSYTGKREKEAEKVLKNAGFGGNVQSGGFFGNTLFVMDSFDNDMKELKGAQEKADYLQSMIDVLEQNGQRATDLYAGLISQRDKYLQYIDNQQDAANSLVNSWISYSQFSNDELSKINVDSLDSFEEYRQKMIEEAKNDESIGKMLADGTLSDEDLENAVNDFMATSTKFSTWYEQWIGNIESNVQHETPTFSDIFGSTNDEASINSQVEAYKTKISEIAGYLNTLYDGDATSDTLSEIAQKYGIVANSTEEYIEELEKLQKTDKNSVIKNIDEAISQCDKTLDKDVIDKLKQLKTIIESYYTDTNSKMSEIKRAKEDINELSEVQKKVKKGHIFSVDEMATLIDKYPDLKKAVIECNNGYKIEAETLKDVMNASKESANVLIADEIRKTKEIIEKTKARIAAYQTEYREIIRGQEIIEKASSPVASNSVKKDAFDFVTNELKNNDWIEGKIGSTKNVLEANKKITEAKKELKESEKNLYELEKLFSQTISTSGKDANDKADKKAQKSIETIDFIEIKIKRLESAISKLKSKAEDTTKSLGSRIKNYASAISKTTSEIIVQQKAYDKYVSKANNVAKKHSLSSSIISKIQDGSIDIKDYSDTTAKHIKSYQDFYEKAIACKDAINELKLSEQELIRNKIQLHIDYYKNLYDSIGTSIDKINNKISLKESANQTIKKSDYKGLGTYYNKQYRYLEKQNSYLVKLQSTVKKGSEEWYKYHSQIDSNNTSIRELTSTIIDNANAMAELNKQVAEKKVEKLDSKDEYSDAKIANANSYKKKNSLIDNKMSNISLRQKAYNNTVKQDKVDLNGYKSNILKSKTKGSKNLKKIKSYVKSNKAIPVSLIDKLTNKTLAISCANYNATLQALETDKETAKLYKETSKTDKANLVVDKFNNISTNYDNKLSVYSQRSQKIEDLMDLNTSKGYKTSAYYYNDSINNELNNYNELIKKRKELQSSLNKGLKSGTIKKYDNNWWQMTNDINNVTNAIAQSKKQLVEYKNTLKEIEWNRFDDLQSAIKGFASENDFMIKELSRQDLADDDTGKLTKNGNAVMALHKSNYEVYTKSAQKYASEIQEINKELEKDPGNTKLIEEKEKLISAYQESISSAQDEKDSIIDLTRNGYTSLQNKIKDLIDDYTKLLDKQKNAYDYSNSISEKTEKIANLRKQLEAYSGDISEEGKAKIQSISVSLKDAEKDLQSTQYDKYISDTKDMLSELQDSLSDEIDKIIKTLRNNFNTIHIDVKDAAKTITNEKKAIGYQSSSDFSKLTSDFAKGSNIESATDKVVNAIISRQNTINKIADNKANTKANTQKLNDQKDLVQKFINSESKNKSKTTAVGKLADTNKALHSQYKKVLTLNQWKELGKLLGITINSKKDLTANGALYKKLKKLGIKGFSVGSHKIDKDQLALLSEEGTELHFDKSRGVLRTIGEGDKIFTNEMTENLWKLAQQNPVKFKNMNAIPILPNINNSLSKGNVSIDIGNITLPSVTKPEEFAGALKDTIKTNSSVQKQLQELTIGTLNKNNNSLGIRRF